MPGRSDARFKFVAAKGYSPEPVELRFPDAGTVGLWTKADSVSYLDDLRLEVDATAP